MRASAPAAHEPIREQAEARELGGEGVAAPAAPAIADGRETVARSRAGGVWVSLVIAAVVLIVLLVFVAQNSGTVRVHFFGASGSFALAVALILAAVCGALIVAVPGSVRIVQLRRTIKKRGGPSGSRVADRPDNDSRRGSR